MLHYYIFISITATPKTQNPIKYANTADLNQKETCLSISFPCLKNKILPIVAEMTHQPISTHSIMLSTIIITFKILLHQPFLTFDQKQKYNLNIHKAQIPRLLLWKYTAQRLDRFVFHAQCNRNNQTRYKAYKPNYSKC